MKTGTDGIASPEYSIVNNDTALGIKVAAKVSAKGATGVSIAAVDRTTKAAPTFKNDGTEEKQVFAFLNTTKTQGTYANAEYDPADTTQLVFTEDVPDKATQLLALDASETGYFQIQGTVVEEPETKWATGDKVTLNVVFDINPYNPAIGGGNQGGGGFTADVTADNISWTGTAATLGALTANNTYAVTYDGSVGGNVTPTFAGYTINNVTGATTGITVNASGRFSCTVDGTYTLVYELENDSNPSDVPSITLVITASGC